jgi:hypothetical protein
MPPWLPEPGYGDFADVRRLTADQLGALQQWIAEGAPEGATNSLPVLPAWSSGWLLGNPDLIVTLPQPYQLYAEGKDIYRNVVIPIPVESRRYVRAVDFSPGNHRVVHHTFINIDNTRWSRRLAEKENPPGFNGFTLPETARMPEGQFLGWQPGKRPSIALPGLAWVLEPGTDLVLQLHLHPTGKSESVQPSVALYFTDQAPTNMAYRVGLQHWKIDIPPGAKDHRIQMQYQLPVDITLLGIAPHAHYLAKIMRGYAILPDGKKESLIYIKDWDFNWQGDYRYAQPIPLPKGTMLVMDFSYDNSADNLRNPNHPPKRVKFGLESSDEMAELFFQMLPRSLAERETLADDHSRFMARESLEYNQALVATDPSNALAQTKIASALVRIGGVDQALTHLRAAIQARPDFDLPYFELGAIWVRQGRLMEAEKAFLAVIKFNPEDYQAYGSLGVVCYKQGRLNEAERYFQAALRLNPQDAIARGNLELVAKARAQQDRKQ